MVVQIHTGAMTDYRFFAVDEFGIVVGVYWLECVNDATAAATGVSLASEALDIEVREVGRQICKCTRQPS